MSRSYGENIELTISGSSHGPSVGMTLDGIPAGLPIDRNRLTHFLSRRAPGNSEFSTSRKETDYPEFLTGIKNDATDGGRLTAIIQNKDVKSTDYKQMENCPRPGHADYTAYVKYGGSMDMSGGGRFSGRMTAPLCIAGGLCKQWLESVGIRITAHILSIGAVQIERNAIDFVNPDLDSIPSAFPVIATAKAEEMKQEIKEAKDAGDSVGGVIQCIVTGLPVGLGDALFDGMESRIAQIVFGIPAVKGISFGSGFDGASWRGSINNDPFYIKNGKIFTPTNHAGGILGGITNGMPLVFDVAIKPTPSIARTQKSVFLDTMEETTLQIKGRHDPCIVPRAVPVMEAAAAIAVFDAWIGHFGGFNYGAYPIQKQD